MSIDVKHYVAIGLGLAVFAGFAMQKSTAPKRTVGFNSTGEFRPLSSFELATEPPPSLATIVQAPRIPANEATVELPNQPLPMIDKVRDDKPIGQQVAFDFGNSSLDDNNLKVPSYVDIDDIKIDATGAQPNLSQPNLSQIETRPPEISLPEISIPETSQPALPQLELQASAENSPLEMEQSTQPFVSAFVSAESSDTSQARITRNASLPQSRWNVNPFVDQAVATKIDESSTDESIAQASKSRKVPDNTIIVEPAAPLAFRDLIDNSTATDGKEDASNLAMTQPPTKDNDFQPRTEPLSNPAVVSRRPTTDVSPNNTWIDTTTMTPEIQREPRSELAASVANVLPRELPLPDSAAQQAVHHIEYGKSLSRRGAAFAARQEFYSALRVIAQANDSTASSNRFSRALSQSILAMKEAKDFVSHNSESELTLDVTSITELHRSRIIDREQASSTTAIQAMEIYYEFAMDKLDEAGGRNAVTVEALYCLGKLHTAVTKTTAAPKKSDVIRAITYHQAALQGDSNNYRSANELGVLKVRMGELASAIEMFKKSLIARPTPQGWQNLAKTHERLGQLELAKLASVEFTRLAQTSVTSSPDSIQWVTNQSFNADAPKSLQNNSRVAELPLQPAAQPKTTTQKLKAKSSSISQRLKALF